MTVVVGGMHATGSREERGCVAICYVCIQRNNGLSMTDYFPRFLVVNLYQNFSRLASLELLQL
jgi:hypothetical protein